MKFGQFSDSGRKVKDWGISDVSKSKNKKIILECKDEKIKIDGEKDEQWSIKN